MVIEEPLGIPGIFSAKYECDALRVELLKVDVDIEHYFSFTFSVLLIGKFHILHSVLIGDRPSFIVDNWRDALVLKVLLQLLHQQDWVIVTVKHVRFLARKLEVFKVFEDRLI